MFKTQATAKIMALMLVLVLGLAGCGSLGPAAEPDQDQPEAGQPIVSPTPEEGTVEVTLYFPDSQAMQVWPETREVEKGGATLEELAIRALLEGPEDPHLGTAFPEGTELISVETVDGTAFVNLSSAIRSVQGSAGSAMFIRSIVWTMTELPGVEQVQILAEGETWGVEGHFEAMEPTGRNVVVEMIFVDQERAAWLQEQVEGGRQGWRTDPLEVARFDGRGLGFSSEDTFKLSSRTDEGAGSGTGEAEVIATRGDRSYVLQLIQPLGPGEEQVWMLNSIRPRN